MSSDLDRVANNLYMIASALRELSGVVFVVGLVMALALYMRPR